MISMLGNVIEAAKQGHAKYGSRIAHSFAPSLPSITVRLFREGGGDREIIVKERRKEEKL